MAAAFALGLAAACTTQPTTSASDSAASGDTASQAAADEDVVVGFIYVGPSDDFGYNQAHAEGAATMGELPGVTIIEEASVPETAAVAETMRSMIEIDGADVLFPTSFGYFDPYILELAEEFPSVQFFHAGGLYQDGVHPDNVGSYFSYIDEAQYIAGIVAAHESESGKLGFVAAKPIPQVLRNINSFTLGAQSVNPDITTQVIFTGDWALPVKEAEATNSLIDQGADVINSHVDSPKVVVETAEKRGVNTLGYHANQSSLAPEGYLTGSEWDWSSIYTRLGEDFVAGNTLMDDSIPHVLRGGLADNFAKLSPYGPGVSDEAQAAADTALAQLVNGDFVIYQGELKDNEGNVILAAGESYEQTAPELEQMNWLIEGVDGSIN
ncbi:MAG: BMP family ABC transporter substrate-binding protein [Cyanobacteria bacterium P01_H01_bin.121]